MGPRTDAIHVNEAIIKFRNRFCHVCSNKAIVRIFESVRNPGKLYFYCDNDPCDYFEFWVPGRDELSMAVATRLESDMVDVVLGLSAEIRAPAAETRSLTEKINGVHA